MKYLCEESILTADRTVTLVIIEVEIRVSSPLHHYFEMFHFMCGQTFKDARRDKLRNNACCGNVSLKASKLSPIAHNGIVSN